MDQALQVDMAGLVAGTLTLNYEYLLAHQYVMVVEGSYYKGWHSHGKNVALAYRWHWARSMNSGFLGIFINGARYYGNEEDFSGNITSGYTLTSVTLGPTIGERWVLPFGLNMVAKMGYGYVWTSFDAPAPDQRTMDRLRSNAAFDTELSLGYAF